MTFPFSTHNYHLRFWMAAGGVDPDEDVRLVVLPPPYMVESLANRHVDGFCVGAPWNSVAVDLGIGFILHFVSEILARAAEKAAGACGRAGREENPDTLRRLVRAHRTRGRLRRGSRQSRRGHRDAGGAEPHRRRAGGDPPHARRPHEGRAGRYDARQRSLSVGRTQRRRPPDPVQAAWLYAQMVRWGQAPLSAELLAAAKAVFRPDLYDAALPGRAGPITPASRRTASAPSRDRFDPDDIAGHLAGWTIRRT